MKCCSGSRVCYCCWVKLESKELHSSGLVQCSAAAEVQANGLDGLGVENNEIVPRTWLRISTFGARRVTQLNSETKLT